MAINDLKNYRIRTYLAKDFDSLRAQLVQYARTYYPDKIQDFSESSMGGMLLDLAAYTGDVMSFYLDHQYNELDYNAAIEPQNIERAIRSSGVKITGASPSIVDLTFVIEVPSSIVSNAIVPSAEALPIVRANSIFTSNSGIDFTLLSDVDFSRKRSDGTFLADVQVGKISGDGTPLSFVMVLDGQCISGKQEKESFSLSGELPFRTIELSRSNVTEILSVFDSKGNVYYEVSSLTDDVVYRNVLNLARDSQEISEAIKVIPAPYRYITNVDLSTRKTYMIMGGGSDTSLEDDAVPDPSEFAISFPYSKTFSRTTVNPLQMLKTRTLGVYAPESQLTVVYRYGGGLSHNVPAKTINTITSMTVDFPLNPKLSVINAVRNGMVVTNKKVASGGEEAPGVDELKSLIPSARNAQERIVTREDLLARIYSIPSNFGRVFRAAVRSNPNNPLATQLYVVSRSANSTLINSPDTLKENLRKYIAPYRLVNDAIDILDAYIVNLSMIFEVVADPSLNKQILLQEILVKLIDRLNIKNFSIDQPIVINDLQNLIYNTPGVIAVTNIEFFNLNGKINNLQYSENSFDVKMHLRKGMLYPPEGGIFEFKFPNVDIIGRTSI
jgi:hypothetical protein